MVKADDDIDFTSDDTGDAEENDENKENVTSDDDPGNEEDAPKSLNNTAE